MTELRAELPPMPDRCKHLPLSKRGYPVPWFVGKGDDGDWDFRVIRPDGVKEAFLEHKCWVCGGKLGRYSAYVIGPMCAVNRVSSEPTSHKDCAVWAAKACPFLSRPHARRREAGLPEEISGDPADHMPGMGIMRNPGVALVWMTEGKLMTFPDGMGGTLFDIGQPSEIMWFAHGRIATREEVTHSIETGMPLLLEQAEKQGQRAVHKLDQQYGEAMKLVPA